MMKYKKSLAALAACLALLIYIFAVLPIFMQFQLSSDTRRFFDNAFPWQTSVARYHVESYAIAFGDPSAYWEFRFGDEENERFRPNHLDHSDSEDDKAYIIKSVHDIWPDVSPETLETYSLFNGDLLLGDGGVCNRSNCEYFALQGPDRAFVYVFKN